MSQLPFICPPLCRHSCGNFQAALGNRLAQRRVHQLVDVELHLVPRVRGHVEDSRVHADGVLGAHFHAVSAIDADPQVDVEADRILLDVGIGVFAGNDRDALRRADGLAQHAPDAAGSAFLPDGEAMAAPESPRERPGLFGILERRRSRKVLEHSHAVRRVKKQIPEKVHGGDSEAADDLRNVQLFPERELAPPENFYAHQDLPPKNASASAVTSTLATAIGNSPFQPSVIS